MSKLAYGTKVEKIMGVYLVGEVCRPVYWEDCNDGTFKPPTKDEVCVRWTDGTVGYIDPRFLEVLE